MLLGLAAIERARTPLAGPFPSTTSAAATHQLARYQARAVDVAYSFPWWDIDWRLGRTCVIHVSVRSSAKSGGSACGKDAHRTVCHADHRDLRRRAHRAVPRLREP